MRNVLKNASSITPIKARFSDANEEGFLAADDAEVDGVILDYLREQGVQKSVNRRILVAATKRQIRLAGEQTFAFDTFADWRGRVYYDGAGMAPQGKDFGRGVLMAAEPARLGVSGLRYLMIGVATTWGEGGLDKASMRERVAAVRRMVRDGSLREIVEGAIAGTDYRWRLAEEPVQFIGLAADLLAALDSGNAFEYKSAVFVGLDATCSGLQILAAVTGCEATASLVNVAPLADGSRADIYMAVAKALAARCAEMAGAMVTQDAEAAIAANETGDHWALFWDRAGIKRGITKKPVMVYCYGGTKRTFAGAIKEAAKEMGLRCPWKAAMWLAALIYDGILADLLPRAHAFMLRLQEVARILARHGKALSFVTRDGLPFMQAVMETEKGRVRCTLADGRSIQAVIQKRSNTLSSRRQATGAAPNIVHQWDALFLRNVVRAFRQAQIDHFFTVHDCFYLRAGDWAKGIKIVRETFRATFDGDVAADLWRQIEDVANGIMDEAPVPSAAVAAWENEGGAVWQPVARRVIRLPDCPARGSLDLSRVLRSEFLFS